MRGKPRLPLRGVIVAGESSDNVYYAARARVVEAAIARARDELLSPWWLVLRLLSDGKVAVAQGEFERARSLLSEELILSRDIAMQQTCDRRETEPAEPTAEEVEQLGEMYGGHHVSQAL